MDYFRITPLKRWTKERMREYLMNKGLSLNDTQIHSGSTFASARISTLRRIYGIPLGDQLYLIIRDRLEREEEIMYKKFNSMSPMANTNHALFTPPQLHQHTQHTPLTPLITRPTPPDTLNMSDIDLGAPAIQSNAADTTIHITKENVFPAPTQKTSTLTQLLAGNTTTPNLDQHQKEEERGSLSNPHQHQKEEERGSLSNPDQHQKEEYKFLDFRETDARAKAYFDKLREDRIKRDREYEDIRDREFINMHPPLLWQTYHIQYLLRSLGLPDELTMQPDDFIFMTAEEFEVKYPKHGDKLFVTIRAKFINPNIKKITKATITDCP